MSMSLADALQNVQLEPGRVYSCKVGDLQIEVRVKTGSSALLPTPLSEDDIMLDPWTEFPRPTPVAVVKPTHTHRLPPDVPDIPEE